MKKLVKVEAAPGLFVETALVAVPAMVVLGVLHGDGAGTFGQVGTAHTLRLISSGAATAIPLLLFAAAARASLSVVGLLQYLTRSCSWRSASSSMTSRCRPRVWQVSPSSGSLWRSSVPTCCPLERKVDVLDVATVPPGSEERSRASTRLPCRLLKMS